MQAVTLAFALLFFISAFIPSNSLWAADYWSYLPKPFAALWGLLTIGLLNEKSRLFLEQNSDKFRHQIKNIPSILWYLILLILMLVFSQEGYFLGDGLLRIRNAERGLAFIATEPLDSLTHALLFKSLSDIITKAVYSYKIISILSGLLLVISANYYLSKIFRDRQIAQRSILILFLTPVSLLFFGYAESYTVLVLFIVLTLLSTYRQLEQNKFSIFPAVYFTLGCLFHLVGIVLLPAVVYAYFIGLRGSNNKIKSSILLFAMLLMALIFLLATAYLTHTSMVDIYSKALQGTGQFLGLSSDKSNYSMFSAGHLIDLFNLLVIAFPLFLLLHKADWESIKVSIGLRFLFVSLLSYLLFFGMLNPVLGMARDWDLFSIWILPLAVFLIILLAKQDLKKPLYYFIVTSVSVLIPWLLINSSTSAAVHRAENMASTEYWTKHSRALLLDEIAQYYKNKNDLNKSAHNYQLAFQNENNPRYLYNAGISYMQQGSTDDAIICFDQIATSYSYPAEIYTYLGDLNYQKKNFNRSLECYYKALDHDKSISIAVYNIAKIYIENNDFTYAEKFLESVLKAHPKDPYLHFYLAISKANLDKYTESAEHIDIAEKYGYDKNVLNGLRNVIAKKQASK